MNYRVLYPPDVVCCHVVGLVEMTMTIKQPALLRRHSRPKCGRSFSSSPTGETPDTTRVVASRLVTPEQLSQNIWTSLEFRYGYTDPQGNFVDMITNQLAVLLGGVDFENRDIRDDITKSTLCS